MIIREDYCIFEETSATWVEIAYLPILRRLTVEMRRKLREKSHRLKWLSECEEHNHFTSRVTVDSRKFKMLPQPWSNKVVQINGGKENLSFIINRVSNTMSNRKGIKI